MNKKLFALTYLLLYCIATFATQVRGTIKDDVGYTIPYASISIKGSTHGTSSNEDGSYTIQLPEGTTTLVVRMIGYKSVSKTINVSGSNMNLDFTLQIEGEELAGVEVKANAEDPAYGIMRKVIANKSKNNRKIKSLETDVYLKGKMYIRSLPRQILGIKLSEQDIAEMQKSMGLDSNNNGTIYLLEQFTKYYYQSPNKTFHKIMAIKTSGDPKGLGFSNMPPIVNIYENNVALMDAINPRGFLSPAHNNAFNYYKYEYLGSFMEDGIMIDKVKFWPKRAMEPTFRGMLYIAENDWAFQQLELILDKKAQINTVDTFILRQQYRRDKEGVWVIQQQVMYPVLSVMGIGIAGDFLTHYNDTRVNESIDPAIFKNKNTSVYDSSALDQKETYWTENRPMEVSKEELNTYHFQDSAAQVTRARKDSFFNATIKNFGFSDFLINGAHYAKRGTKVGLDPLIGTLNFNTIEGWIIGLNPYWRQLTPKGDSWEMKWYNHFGFSNKIVQSLLSIKHSNIDSTFIGRKTDFWFSAGTQVKQINNTNPIIASVNSLYSLILGHNYRKLYQSMSASIGVSRNFGNGLKLSAEASAEERVAMNNSTFYSFVNKKNNKYTINNPIDLPTFQNHTALLLTLGIRYQPGWKFVQYPKFRHGEASNAPIFYVNYQKAFGLNNESGADFDKWKAQIKQQLPLKLLGTFNYNLIAGGFLTQQYVGNPDRYYLNGNQTILANSYGEGFQTAPYYEYNSIPELYTQAHLEWHLNGFLTNKIPGLRQLKWNLVLSGNGMYIDSKNYYGEYGIGLENIGVKLFKMFRVDMFVGKGALQPKEWRYGFRLGSTVPLNGIF